MADNKFYPVDLNDNMINNSASRGGAFVDFAGLDYFWSLAKQYVDTADAALAARATALETTVNGAEGTQGLVQQVAALRTEVDALGGAEGGIQGMIDTALEAYSTTEEMNSAIATETAAREAADTELNTAITSETAAREAADKKLGEDLAALSEVVGAPAEGETPASGIFGIIEENEKTTAEALTNLDNRAKALEAKDTELSGAITSETAAREAADAVLTKAIEDEVARATGVESGLDGRVGTLETTVGDANSGLVQKVAALEAKDTELNGAIETVSQALEAHKVAKDGEVAIHVSAEDRAKWNTAASEISTFLKDADMTEKAVDTLKELQAYMESDAAAAAELVNRVAGLETTVNGDAESEVTGLVEKVAANAQAIVAAETAAKKYTDDAVGTWTNGETPASGLRKEIEEKVTAAEGAAKTYADGLVTDGEGKSRFDAAGSAAAAQEAAMAYTDELYAGITFVTKAQIDGLFA